MALARRLPVAALALLALAGCGSHKPAAAKTTGGCTKVSQPKPGPRTEAKPKQKLDASKTYDVVLTTNCGSFTIELAPKASPAASASFVSLVRKGFFDRTVFHRIIPGFVVQGGDPTASGSGGPGYSTVDPPAASTRYTLGVVAMAKTSAEKPGTAGSQFFVVTAKDAQLPPDYAVIGTVVKGLPAVRRIEKLGDPAGSGNPLAIVEIEKATVHVD